MAVLTFTLSEEGVAVFHDALSCIGRFSEDVCLEARKDKLTLTALNLSKSAYVCFSFASNRFFSKYRFEGTPQSRDRFFCQLYIRSLISVFRARQGSDSGRDRDRDTTIERCDVNIDDGPGVKSRVVAKIVFRNGITASHALPFEMKAPTHAKFVKEEAANHWTISSRTLRQLMDHFGPGIELLDINTDDENLVANFTCFTEKVAKTSTNNEEVLKKPLHTSIAMDMDEFDEIEVLNKLHIIISVKDFRSILQHAQLTSGNLSAWYSNPGRPMKLSYGADAILCEFILMTVGEKDSNAQKGKKARAGSAHPGRPGLEASASASVAPSNRENSVATENVMRHSEAPIENRPPNPTQQRSLSGSRPRQSQFEIRPEPMPPPTMRSEGLFVTQNVDDQLWEPMNPEEDEDESDDNARLEWNASNAPGPSTKRISSHLPTQADAQDKSLAHIPAGLEPTQRLSEVRKFGLFSE